MTPSKSPKHEQDYSVNSLLLHTSVPVKIGSDCSKQSLPSSCQANRHIRYTFGLNAFKNHHHSIKSIICEQPKRAADKTNPSSKSMESLHLNGGTTSSSNGQHLNDCFDALPPPPPKYRDSNQSASSFQPVMQKQQIVEFRQTPNNGKFVKQTTVDYYV